ncbi:hypothetical protein D3C72_1726590 [compost metagenome]
MDLADDFRARKQQQFVVALHVDAMVREARAAIVGLAKLVALDHGAHGAVQDQDAVAQQPGQVGGPRVRTDRCGSGAHDGAGAEDCRILGKSGILSG